MEFKEVATAARFRDVVARLARREILREYPPDRYGDVTSIDYAANEANVDIKGQDDDVVVAFSYNLQPTHIGQRVRISGSRGDRYVESLISNTPWIAPTLVNGWVPYGSGWSAPGYRRTPTGSVQMRGLIKDGTAATIFTLPLHYAPATNWTFPVTDNSADNLTRLDINSSGLVTLPKPYDNAYVSLYVTFIPTDE